MGGPRALLPVCFKLGEAIGGGVQPTIGAGQLAFAYVESERIFVVPIGGPFYEPIGIFYSAPCTTAPRAFVEQNFNAPHVTRTRHRAGSIVDGLWKPGFISDGRMADIADLRRDKQELYGILSRLFELFQTIEPDQMGLRAHGPKVRELHLLAAMEVESYLKLYLSELASAPSNRLSTSDYFKLKAPLELGRFEVAFQQFPGELSKISPFKPWSVKKPTASIFWYSRYNASKHDRRFSSCQSTLKSAVHTVAAVILLFVKRYGMRELYGAGDLLSNLTNGGVSITYSGPGSSAYVPRVKHGPLLSGPCTFFLEGIQPWRREKLSLK